MTDWEKRARELFPMKYPDADAVLESMLQLGREMVAEALKSDRRHVAYTLACADMAAEAADERAEEIAKAIENESRNYPTPTYSHAAFVKSGIWMAAKVARSFISKPEPAIPWLVGKLVTCLVCDAHITYPERHTCPVKPKTREQVLEEALKEIHCFCEDYGSLGRPGHWRGCAFEIARSALEWKP